MKDFIPYNEALALKNLGFEEPCFGFYVTNEVKYHIASFDKNTNKSWIDESFCTAPTFSQVFRFFREKYNLDCSIMLHVATNGSRKGIYFEKKSYKYQIRKSFKNPFWIEFDSFKTYEEAELECLRKLIEIVKTNKL